MLSYEELKWVTPVFTVSTRPLTRISAPSDFPLCFCISFPPAHQRVPRSKNSSLVFIVLLLVGSPELDILFSFFLFATSSGLSSCTEVESDGLYSHWQVALKV